MTVKCHRKRSPPATATARLPNKLSLLVGLVGSFSSSSGLGGSSPRSPTQRSPRCFAYDGAVGLGIVADMNDTPSTAAHEYGSATVSRTPRTASAPRSEPIPIVAARPTSTGFPRKQFWSEEEDMELSESYTCVTSHVGGDAVRRTVYVDVDDGAAGDHWGGWFGVFSGSPPPARRPEPLPVADFLSRCFRKRVHGLGIFMYRGDKGFCSEECRYHQMTSSEHRENRVSGAPKPFDCSLSPCSDPLLFPAGVAAA